MSACRLAFHPKVKKSQNNCSAPGGFGLEGTRKAGVVLNIRVQEAEKLSLEEIRRFVEATEAIRFAGEEARTGVRLDRARQLTVRD